MASTRRFYTATLLALIFTSAVVSSSAQLTTGFYDKSCPKALPTIKSVVKAAVEKEARMGASLLRLHFHDCFVNGCDGSILLDTTEKFESEKNANPNRNSARGFEVIDEIKAEVDNVCGGAVVSCADILAVAAHDSVVALGGPSWDLHLGRRDSTNASIDDANANIPSPFDDLAGLLKNFESHGLDVKDLVALSGGHTLGFSQCAFFRNRIYNGENIDPEFAEYLKKNCPKDSGNGDANLAPFDPTPYTFDKKYFDGLVNYEGLLHSDQVLFSGGSTDGLVRLYSENIRIFSEDFAYSMIKMGNIKPLTGYEGEIRKNCRLVNKY